jgi:hypothetical protein
VIIKYVFVTTFVRLSLADLVYAAVMDSISFHSLEKQASQWRRDETVGHLRTGQQQWNPSRVSRLHRSD